MCPPPAARCLELQTTQSTLMLKKKKEMRAVDDALDFMKEEFRKRMEACDEREARFKDKQAEMKAMVGVLSSDHCPPFAPYVAAAAPCRAVAAATVAVDGGIGTTELATVVTFPCTPSTGVEVSAVHSRERRQAGSGRGEGHGAWGVQSTSLLPSYHKYTGSRSLCSCHESSA